MFLKAKLGSVSLDANSQYRAIHCFNLLHGKYLLHGCNVWKVISIERCKCGIDLQRFASEENIEPGYFDVPEGSMLEK